MKIRPDRREDKEKKFIENILAYAIKEREGTPKEQLVYYVQPEIVKWATLHAQLFLDRYKDAPEKFHWKTEEKRNNYIGMIGHKCFDMTLGQYSIPRDSNDPVVQWTQSKPYDFYVDIPNVGSIEVKTVGYQTNKKRLLIKEAEWHGCNWVVAIKLLDELPTKALIVGVATKEEVENEFNFSEEGTFPCFEASCYWRLLEDLTPAIPFIEAMEKVTKTKTRF